MFPIERTIPGLTANTHYIARVRAYSPLGVASEWSEALSIDVPPDTSVPNPPTALVTDFTSPELFISWTAPGFNTDGSAIGDFQEYEISLTASAMTETFHVQSAFFAYPFAQNKANFGTAQSSIAISIKAVDLSGNKSTALTGTATNAVPTTPTTAPELASAFTLINIKMTAQAIDKDIEGFDLYHSTDVGGPFTLLVQTAGDNYTHEVDQGTTHYYKFKSRDVFGQVSSGFSPVSNATTFTTTDIDTVPPATPTGLAGTPGIDTQTQHPYINVSWDANTEPDMGTYELRIRKTGDVVFRTVMKAADLTTHKFVDLHSTKLYEIQIRAIDLSGNVSAWVPDPTPLNVTTGTGTITYDPSASGTLIVSSTGAIQSSDFVSGGTQGWNLSENGLEINEGIVRAPAIQIGISNENLLINSSFENPATAGTIATSWAIYPTSNTHTYSLTNEVTPLYQSRVQKIVAATAADVGVKQTYTANATYPGSSWFTANIWVRQLSGTVRNGRVQIKDVTNSVTSLSTAQALANGTWVRISHSVLLAFPSSQIEVTFYAESAAIGQTFYFEGAMLTNSSYPIEYSPRGLEIPDNYILNAYIQSLTADKFTTGTLNAATITVGSTGFIQSFDWNGTNAGYRLSTTGATFQNGSVTITGSGGATILDSTSLRSIIGGSTRFLVNGTGVYIGGGSSSTASVYFEGSKTVFQDTSGAYAFEIDTSQTKILRLHAGTTDAFYLGKDGSAYFAGAIAGGTIDIGGADATSFHVDVNGNMWLGAATFGSATFKVANTGDVTATSFTGTSQIGNSVSNVLQSGNYSAGVSGWIIKGNGDVEFNAGTFRGAISGASIDIGGADSTSFHVDTSGNMWLGNASFGSAPFTVASTGALTVSGGAISGGTISGTTVTGGTIRTASSGQRVELSSSFTERISFYSGNGSESAPGQIYSGLTIGGTPNPFVFIKSPSMSGFAVASISLQGRNASNAGLASATITAGDGIGMSGPTSITGTLDVSSTAQFSGLLHALSTFTVESTATFHGTINGGTINGVDGSFTGTFGVSGGVLLGAGLGVSGTSTFTGTTTHNNGISVNNNTAFLNAGVSVSGAAAFGSTTSTTGVATFSNHLAGNAGSASAPRIRTRGGSDHITFDWAFSKVLIYIDDTLECTFTPSTTKTFVIDHPIDKDRYLIHACLEGPESAVYYRGRAKLNRGVAEVELPSYFEAATNIEGRTVLVTPILDDNEPFFLSASYPANGRFRVKSMGGNNGEFFWEVKAVRSDTDSLVVEPKRSDVNVMGSGPYKYYTVRK